MVPTMDDLVGDAGEPIRTTLPVVVAEDQHDRQKREPIYVEALSETPDSSTGTGTGVAMGLLALMLLVGGLFVFREAIMHAVPASTPYYRTAGLVETAPGLEIANVVTTKSRKDGISDLIVKGEIANVADNTVPVPPIHLIMRDDSRTNLYEWTVSAATPSLKAGERSRFTAIARNVPAGAIDVEVSFAKKAAN